MSFMRVIRAALYAAIAFAVGYLSPHGPGSAALAASPHPTGSSPGGFSLVGVVNIGTMPANFGSCTNGQQCHAQITVQIDPNNLPTGVACENTAQPCLMANSVDGSTTLTGTNGTPGAYTGHAALAVQFLP